MGQYTFAIGILAVWLSLGITVALLLGPVLRDAAESQRAPASTGFGLQELVQAGRIADRAAEYTNGPRLLSLPRHDPA